MSMIKVEPKIYDDGRTKQSFKSSTEISKILHKAQKTGVISHLAKHEGVYGDFADFDFATAQNTIARANSIFAELPSELRNEFSQDPAKFFEYANNDENVGRLTELLPGLAAPGRQMIDLKNPEEPPVPTAPVKSAAEGMEPAKPAVEPAIEPAVDLDPPPAG